MTEIEFRARYSEIIAYYQYIEMHLKGICASFPEDENRTWFDMLDDYESDPFGKLLLTIQKYQNEKKVVLFSAEDFSALDKIRKERNYWVHRCFAGDKDGHVIFKHGAVRDEEFVLRLNSDLHDAVDWDKKITEIERMTIPVPPSV